MALVTVASFDLVGPYFSPEGAFFPPLLCSLGVTNDIIVLMNAYNDLSKKFKSRICSWLVAILLFGVFLPIILMVIFLSSNDEVVFYAPAGVSTLLFTLGIVFINVDYKTQTRELLSEFSSKREFYL